jgi:site-specific DNA-methyltransferase (adenine-specific)
MTEPHHTTTHTTLYHGNNMDVLPTLPDNSVDAVITDPPYELGFMGKSWDASGIAYNVEMWREVLRVLKPGGHLCAFGGTRTYHRMAVAIEDAGFEIRDSLHWIYGSGFPKSLDVSKAIDKAAGAEREVIGKHPNPGGTSPRTSMGDGWQSSPDLTAPATDAAKQWDGWGTALKPAHEPIVLARKPFNGTVAANVLQHGTGALNINATRIAADDQFGGGAKATSGFVTGYEHDGWTLGNTAGRWPANVIVDDTITDDWARYFYCAKPSRTERNAGLDGLPEHTSGQMTNRKEGSAALNNPRTGAGRINGGSNFHPTVKPLTLMQWLIRLVTPPHGTILDPFAGSGTTLAAATLEGVHAIGIELTDDYLPIITARCNWAETQTTQRTLFDTHD